MKRRYKLLLIIIIGSIITFFISTQHKNTKINIMAIGDSISLGMTPYNVIGPSFNDYLAEYYEKNNNLNYFNKEFSIGYLTIDKLNDYLEKNEVGKTSKIPIKQLIEKSNILTIAIGVDEFANLSLRTNDFKEYQDNFINEYKKLLTNIRSFYDKDIIIMGLYPALKFSKNDTLNINSKLQKIADMYNAKYMDLLPISLNEKYYLQKNSYYMSYEAHQVIFKNILKLLS